MRVEEVRVRVRREEGGGRTLEDLTVEGRDVTQVRFTEIYCSEYY